MRRVLSSIFCCLLTAAVAEPLVAQVELTYKCVSPGRYWKRNDKGPIHYCQDGTYYSEQTAPAHVKAFFGKSSRTRNVIVQRHAAARRSADARPDAADTVAASTKPVSAPIGTDLIASIETGATRDDVLAKLGPPHGSVSNLGDEGTEEVWSYRLPSEDIAKVRLDRGKVISVQLPH